MKPIYEPKGKAKEYGELAINIYTGCPHRCFYCFAPNVLHREREAFHNCVEPRKDIVQETRNQIEREGIIGKTIHLCFTCDPYPTGYDTSPTREIIRVLKESGNHIQILTKGDGRRDFDLLDGNDWYGVTLDGGVSILDGGLIDEKQLLTSLKEAKSLGIKTWVSFEPVLDDKKVINLLEKYHDYFDKVKIGKLNYNKSNIDWKRFGEYAERMCWQYDIDYYIKDSLRKEMEK
ncbi:radical SAM protein [uncultured Ruminococcus sp.]|uniref:radical SAM protein n=1 Tax=uncultured Ruminococcus sp. TaxID=165186 RepID=UPI0025F37E9F|nr:radical SAM protein [uncultured Ruminococcus sp.]